MRSLLAEVSETLKEESDKRGQNCFNELLRFKSVLNSHMEIENAQFYPDYIRAKKERGESIDGTKKFIQEMDDIANGIDQFIETYHSEAIILENEAIFQKDLSRLQSTLSVRIDVEEEGLFEVYLVM